jgi:hypothetical protein
MKTKILKFFKLIIWLLFGMFLFIFRLRKIYSVYSFTYESRTMKSGYKKAGIVLMFLGMAIVNVIVWSIIYFLCKK